MPYFFPPSLMCEVQSTMDTTVRGAFLHKTRIFKRGICFIVAPSSSHPRPKTSASSNSFEMFCHMSPKSLASKIHLHYVRIEYHKTKKEKTFLPPIFSLLVAKIHPHQLCLLQHILKPFGLHYSVSNVLTVEEIGYQHFQLGFIALSNVTGHGSIKTC